MLYPSIEVLLFSTLFLFVNMLLLNKNEIKSKISLKTNKMLIQLLFSVLMSLFLICACRGLGAEKTLDCSECALNEYIRKGFGHFYAQVNVEVTGGHQRSNSAECHYFSGWGPRSAWRWWRGGLRTSLAGRRPARRAAGCGRCRVAAADGARWRLPVARGGGA